MKTVICLVLVLLGSRAGFGQNWAARLYATMPADDPLLNMATPVPTNCIATWLAIGTNTAVNPPFVFVGDDTARASFAGPRLALFRNWKTNFFDLVEANTQLLLRSNIIYLVQQRASYLSNVAFWSTNIFPSDNVTLSNRVNDMLQLRAIEARLQAIGAQQ